MREGKRKKVWSPTSSREASPLPNTSAYNASTSDYTTDYIKTENDDDYDYSAAISSTSSSASRSVRRPARRPAMISTKKVPRNQANFLTYTDGQPKGLSGGSVKIRYSHVSAAVKAKIRTKIYGSGAKLQTPKAGAAQKQRSGGAKSFYGARRTALSGGAHVSRQRGKYSLRAKAAAVKVETVREIQSRGLRLSAAVQRQIGKEKQWQPRVDVALSPPPQGGTAAASKPRGKHVFMFTL